MWQVQTWAHVSCGCFVVDCAAEVLQTCRNGDDSSSVEAAGERQHKQQRCMLFSQLMSNCSCCFVLQPQKDVYLKCGVRALAWELK